MKKSNLIKKIYSRIFSEYNIVNLIKREIQDNWKVLDAGCGRPGNFEKIQKNIYKVGIDHYKPYLDQRKKLETHNKLVLGDVRSLPFKDNFFDCAVSIEVLEHLNKKDGLKMIKELERVARKKIILTTPNGFLPTYAGPDDNPDESHVSGWSVDELKKSGFEVYGTNGLKWFWKVKNGIIARKINVPLLSSLIIHLSQFIVYNYPKLSFQLFLVKNLNKNHE